METHAEKIWSYRRAGRTRRGLMSRISAFAATIAGACLALPLGGANAADKQVARGKYLVTFGSCTDYAITPGHFLGKPDMSKLLGGSDVGFAIPGLGIRPEPDAR